MRVLTTEELTLVAGGFMPTNDDIRLDSFLSYLILLNSGDIDQTLTGRPLDNGEIGVSAESQLHGWLKQTLMYNNPSQGLEGLSSTPLNLGEWLSEDPWPNPVRPPRDVPHLSEDDEPVDEEIVVIARPIERGDGVARALLNNALDILMRAGFRGPGMNLPFENLRVDLGGVSDFIDHWHEHATQVQRESERVWALATEKEYASGTLEIARSSGQYVQYRNVTQRTGTFTNPAGERVMTFQYDLDGNGDFEYLIQQPFNGAVAETYVAGSDPFDAAGYRRARPWTFIPN